MASHLRMPGQQMIPTLTNLSLSREERCAQVLEGYLRAALDQASDPVGLFLDYPQLPEAVWNRLAPHFHIEFDEEELALLRQSAQFNAKAPQLYFEADSEQKCEGVSPAVRELTARILDPLYRRLQEVTP